MRKELLIAMCGGGLLYSFAAYKQGNPLEASALLLIVFIIMAAALWMFKK